MADIEREKQYLLTALKQVPQGPEKKRTKELMRVVSESYRKLDQCFHAMPADVLGKFHGTTPEMTYEDFVWSVMEGSVR